MAVPTLSLTEPLQPGRYETLLWLGALCVAADRDQDFLRDWIALLPDAHTWWACRARA